MNLWKRNKWRVLNMKEIGPPLLTVADAAIGVGAVGEGRLIPLAIVDSTARPDLEELVRVHQFTPPGDVESQWMSIEGNDERIGLLLSFQRPSKLTTLLEFTIPEKAFLVDQILTAKGLYLQPGRTGDRFITTRDAPRILVEIPATSFKQIWDEMYYRRVVKDMRKRGLNRQQAKKAAADFLKEMREFGQLRIPSDFKKLQKYFT